jgi:hypothetical protein
MTDQNTAGTGNELQRKEDQAREQLAAQREAADRQIQQQDQVRDQLTQAALQKEHDRYQEWLAKKGEAQERNQLMPAADLPPAPREPLPTTGTAEEIQAGRQALDAYKASGFVAHRDMAPAATGPQATAGDHSLNQERAFRDRQLHLADKITDPKTTHEQRERLELQRATEYHDHHAESWNNVAELQAQLGYPNASIAEARKKSDHHKEQASLVANKLHEFDRQKGMVPKEVAVQIPQKNTDATHAQKGGRDPHLDALAAPHTHAGDKSAQAGDKSALSAPKEQQATEASNPALDRIMQRRQEMAGRHAGSQPNAHLREQVVEAQAREGQIEVAKQEALGQKAEADRKAAHAR